MNIKDSTTLSEAIFKLSRLKSIKMSYSNDLCQLTVLQVHALIFLKQHGNEKMTKLAEQFHIELPSATSLFNKLHNLGLVERQADPNDRRIIRIALTKKGDMILQEATEHRKKKVKKWLSYISKDDQKNLLRILTTLTNKLEEEHEI